MLNAHRIAGRPRGRTAHVTRRGAGASWRGFVLSVGAVCVPAAAFLACAGEARAQTEDVEHWSATLTRGHSSDVNGYNGINPNSTIGSLAPSTFTYADVSYSVDVLFAATYNNGELKFRSHPLLPTDTGLKLRVPTFRVTASGSCPAGGTVDLELSSASTQPYSVSSPATAFEWDMPDFTCLTVTPWTLNSSTTGTVTLLGPPVVPGITGHAVTSTPGQTSEGATTPDTYGFGETIVFTVTFSHRVNVRGDPTLPFSLGAEDDAETVNAAYRSGSGSTSLVFAYTVQEDDTDPDGVCRCNESSEGGTLSLALDSDDAIEGTGAGDPDATVTLLEGDPESGHKVDGSRPANKPPQDDPDDPDDPDDDDPGGGEPDDPGDPTPTPAVPAAGLALLAALLAAGRTAARRLRPPPR